MSDQLLLLSHPELVIGIAGPIGIDIDAITEEVGRALDLVGYEHETVRVTDLMKEHTATDVAAGGTDYFSTMNFKMDYANKLCESAGDPEFLMRIAMKGIQGTRTKLLAKTGSLYIELEDIEVDKMQGTFKA